MNKQGQFIKADFFDNIGGLNTTDSPFKVQENQAIQGYNYDYTATGGFKKRYGHGQINASPNAILPTLGCFMHKTYTNVKSLLRATNSKLQKVDTNTGVTTNVANDTVSAGTNFFTGLQPVCFTQFNTQMNQVAWMAGGGQGSGVLGGYNGTKYTQNGVAVPTGTLSDSISPVYGTQNLTTGTYYYAVSFIKASTGAESNATLDWSVGVTTGSNTITRISLTGVSNLDTTKYSQIRLYRSAKTPTGVTGFTVGDIVATVPSTATYIDDDGTVGSNSADNVPRAGNVVLDNSTLPSGTFNVVTTWKRRLVTAQNSTLYFSDLSKPESWPTVNSIQVPSGGPITALGVISYNTNSTLGIDEILVVFKEREMWVIAGNNFVQLTNEFGVVYQESDVILKFVATIGCINQNLITLANGYLYWIDYRGIYFWNGAAKPVYISRPIEYDFSKDGDLQLGMLQQGVGVFYRRNNQIIWFLSSSSQGTQKLALKLDLRLTMLNPMIDSALNGGILDGVFCKDLLNYTIYGAYADVVSATELLYGMGDDGRFWSLYTATDDNAQAVNLSYRTKPLEMGLPTTIKRFHKVIVWCQETTKNNLTLNYWMDYVPTTRYESTTKRPIADNTPQVLWDVAFWDVDLWDQVSKTYVPIVFNLSGDATGTDGTAITLEFNQASTSTPVTILGFSVLFTEVGVRN